MIYAVGDNPVAVRLSGVRTWQVQLAVYTLGGIFAALAGILLAGRTGAVDLQLAQAFLLPSVAAAVIGGTSIFGGVGSYSGTILGALILSVLKPMLTFLRRRPGSAADRLRVDRPRARLALCQGHGGGVGAAMRSRHQRGGRRASGSSVWLTSRRCAGSGSNVIGVVGSTPERARARAPSGEPAARLRRASRRSSPTRRLTSSTSPAPTTPTPSRPAPCSLPASTSSARSRSRLTTEETADLLRRAEASGLGARRLLQHPLLSAVPSGAAMVASGEIGEPRLVTGSYLQDWLLLDDRLELAARAGEGGRLRAVADIGSHWLDLARFVTGQRDRRGHGRPPHPRPGPPSSPGPGGDIRQATARPRT